MPLRRSRMPVVKPDIEDIALVPCKNEESQNDDISLEHHHFTQALSNDKLSSSAPISNLTSKTNWYNSGEHQGVKREELEYNEDTSNGDASSHSSGSGLDIHVPQREIDSNAHIKPTQDDIWHTYSSQNRLEGYVDSNEGMPRAHSMTFLPFGAGMSGSASIQDLVMLLGSSGQNSSNSLQLSCSNANLANSDLDNGNDSSMSGSIPAFMKENHVSESQRWGFFSAAPSLSNNSSSDDFMSLLENHRDYPSHMMNSSNSNMNYHGRPFYMPGQGGYIPSNSVGHAMQYPHINNPLSHSSYPINMQRFRSMDQFSSSHSNSDPPLRHYNTTRQSMAPPLSIGHFLPFSPQETPFEGDVEGLQGDINVKMSTSGDEDSDDDQSIGARISRQNSKRLADFREDETSRSQRVKKECGEVGS
jgi:hypothetical protein